VICRCLANRHGVLEQGQCLLPVRPDGQRGFPKHGIQICLADARDVNVVLARRWVPSFDVSIPTQLALEGYAKM
jgi:hypothetical protein